MAVRLSPAFVVSYIVASSILAVAVFGVLAGRHDLAPDRAVASVVIAPRTADGAATVDIMTDAATYLATTEIFRAQLTDDARQHGATTDTAALSRVTVRQVARGTLSVMVPAATPDAMMLATGGAYVLVRILDSTYAATADTLGYTATVVPAAIVSGATWGAIARDALLSLLTGILVAGAVFALVAGKGTHGTGRRSAIATHASNARLNLQSGGRAAAVSAALTDTATDDGDSYMHRVYADYDRAIAAVIRDDATVAPAPSTDMTPADAATGDTPLGTAAPTAPEEHTVPVPLEAVPLPDDTPDDTVLLDDTHVTSETASPAAIGAPPANLPIADPDETAALLRTAVPATTTDAAPHEPTPEEVRARLNQLLAGTLKV